ncbi:hypothetical protein ACH5RR_003892 [Cinchona calisaya]|uniref:Uncharacterized protein n=1 Tax=Cinchona calisaya TaxID=153742 RepID=A0ABD3AWE7_9GENT
MTGAMNYGRTVNPIGGATGFVDQPVQASSSLQVVSRQTRFGDIRFTSVAPTAERANIGATNNTTILSSQASSSITPNCSAPSASNSKYAAF